MAFSMAMSPQGKKETSASRPGKPLKNVLAMAKGNGEESYSKNSKLQGVEVIKYALPELEKALEKLSLPADGRVVLADLGCSSGPNTIGNLAFIADKLRAKFATTSLPSPEFQAFFNDLPSNDFNNLFQLLSSDTRNCGTKDFFAAGLPGSFFGRLFPRSSVNVFFCANCLQWISEVPASGRADAEKAFAYQERAAADLKVFLDARAAELVPGGLLFLYFCGRSSPDILNLANDDDQIVIMLFNLINQVWDHLISQGVTTQEQRDAFSIPLYPRSRGQVKEVVESFASEFEVHTLKLLETSIELFKDVCCFTESAAIAAKLRGASRSVLGPIIDAHFGSKIAEIFWQHLEMKIAQEVPFMENFLSTYDSWRHCVALIRK